MPKIDKLQYLMMMQNGSLKHFGHPPSWISKIKFFNGHTICISMQNFVEIGHAVAKTSRFFAFFK